MSKLVKELCTVALFAAIIVAFCLIVNSLSSASDEAQTQLVRDAVKNAAVTCYAVEGAYPMDLEYLRVHYGLAFDEERYVVVYDAFASNLMPAIRVMERGTGA